jgi:hypothetical protein
MGVSTPGDVQRSGSLLVTGAARFYCNSPSNTSARPVARMVKKLNR